VDPVEEKHLKDKINELVMNVTNKISRNLYREINEF
jgi:hypothetical protein